MHPRINAPMLFSITLSVLLHGWLLHSGVLEAQAIHAPAKMQIAPGVVSVELTLMPSIASVAIPETVPEVIPKEPDPVVEKTIPKPEAKTPAPLIEKPSQPEPIQQKTPDPSINAMEQAGAMEEDKGVLTEATTQATITPFYPPFSRRRGEEGEVILALEINVNGKVTDLRIEQSSGHKRLDKAAIQAVKKARFTPAIRFGNPCASTLIQTFTFRLTHD